MSANDPKVEIPPQSQRTIAMCQNISTAPGSSREATMPLWIQMAATQNTHLRKLWAGVQHTAQQWVEYLFSMNTVLGPNFQPAPPSLLPLTPKVNIYYLSGSQCLKAFIASVSGEEDTEIQQCVQGRTDKGQFTHHMLWDNCSYCFYVVDTVDQLQSSLDHFMICLRRLFLWFKFFRNAFTLKLNTRNVSLVPDGWYNYLQT